MPEEPRMRLSDIILRTLPFTPCPELGYDPLPAILSGRKKHTLRGQPKRGHYEVSVKGRRIGLIVECYQRERLNCDEYLTGEIARRDGMENAEALAQLLQQLRPAGDLPEQLWLCWFRPVVIPDQLKHLCTEG